MKKIIITIALLIFSANQGFAATVYCTNCSNVFTQALERTTNLEQLKSLLKSYQEMVQQTQQQIALVKNNIEQYANMVQNTIALPGNVRDAAKGELSKLAQLTNTLRTSRGDINALTRIFDDLH